MSKYTTEVRYILEHDAGLEESAGANKIDDVIDDSWDKTFNVGEGAPIIGSVAYHEDICKKILRHYYFREIGAETAGLWKFWMNRKVSEIADYYTKLYASMGLLNLENALKDVNYTKTHMGSESQQGQKATTDNLSITGQDASFGNSTVGKTNTGTQTDSGTSSEVNKFSETPQGGLTGLENNTYLTDARMINGTKGNTRTDNLTENVQENHADTVNKTGSEARTINDTQNKSGSNQFTEQVQGKWGGRTYAELLQQYRDTLFNLDVMIIGEFKDLFMNIW